MRRLLVERGKSWEEEAQGSPRGWWPWLGAFLSVFWSSVPHGIRWRRREKATYEFTRGGWGRTSVGALDYAVFPAASLELSASRAWDWAMSPHPRKASFQSPAPSLSQRLVNRKPDQLPGLRRDSVTQDRVSFSLSPDFLFQKFKLISWGLPITQRASSQGSSELMAT